MASPRVGNDVVIVGGGIIGLACAWRLAGEGARVALLERGECGREASWAGAGIVHAGSPSRTDALAQLRRASAAQYPAFARQLHEESGIDPEFRVCGSLDVITDDNQAASARRDCAADPRLKLLSAEHAVAVEPHLTRSQRGALLDPDAAQVRNPRLLAALRSACAARGVQIREHAAVRTLRLDAGRAVAARLDAQDVHADWIVLAAGAWSTQLFVESDESVRVHPVRGQIVLLEQTPPALRHVVQAGKSYLVGRDDGRVLIGATEEPDAGFDKRPTAEGVSKLLDFALRTVPELRRAVLVTAWAGLRPGTPDGRPYIGPHPHAANLLVAAGHMRSGLTLAPVTAELITQLVLGRAPQLPTAPFLPGRATAPERPRAAAPRPSSGLQP